jgi:hypothetical protein
MLWLVNFMLFKENYLNHSGSVSPQLAYYVLKKSFARLACSVVFS